MFFFSPRYHKIKSFKVKGYPIYLLWKGPTYLKIKIVHLPTLQPIYICFVLRKTFSTYKQTGGG
jgi:hypothetical protein